MAKPRSYGDLLSEYELVWTRNGSEIARERVMALDKDDALADAMGLEAKHGIGLFDESVECRAEVINA
jgi:hypothetical protein